VENQATTDGTKDAGYSGKLVKWMMQNRLRHTTRNTVIITNSITTSLTRDQVRLFEGKTWIFSWETTLNFKIDIGLTSDGSQAEVVAARSSLGKVLRPCCPSPFSASYFPPHHPISPPFTSPRHQKRIEIRVLMRVRDLSSLSLSLYLPNLSISIDLSVPLSLPACISVPLCARASEQSITRCKD